MTAAPETGRTLTFDEAVALEEATDPRVSPDGRLVAFCVGALSREEEHPRGAIYVVPSDGSAPARPFTSGVGLDSAPRWSPDGRQLAFLSDRHERGKPSLYVMPADGGEAERFVIERGEVSDPQWSPDGTRIAVLLRAIDSIEEEKRKKEGRDDAVVVDDENHTCLWIVDVSDRTCARLSPDGMNVWAHAWSPDSRRIALVHTVTPTKNEAYTTPILSTLEIDRSAHSPAAPRVVCPLYGAVASLRWSPDGAYLAFVGSETQRPFSSAVATPLVVAADGGAPRPLLTGHPAQFNWVDWLACDEVAAAGMEDVYGAYYRVTLSGGEALPLFPGSDTLRGEPREFALSADRSTLAFTRADICSPGDVWVVEAAGTARRLTTLNPALDAMQWSPVEPVSWTAPDGLEIHGLLMKPPGYVPGRRYPTIVHVHGGPAGLWGDGFYATWHDWDQFLAARGYAVLLPNPRGSTGRGTPYVRANFDDVGGGEWQDVLSGARWLIESGVADPARMGIGGWSWGGYLTAWAVTQTDLFKAAVMGAGLSNLLSDHGQNDIPDVNRLYFRDLPYYDASAYWDVSPLKYAARVTTPTLIAHGEKDERVTPAQSREFYRALRTLGVPTRLVLYPREPHGFTERAHQLDLLKRIVAWFDTYLRDKDVPAPVME